MPVVQADIHRLLSEARTEWDGRGDGTSRGAGAAGSRGSAPLSGQAGGASAATFKLNSGVMTTSSSGDFSVWFAPPSPLHTSP